MRIIYITTKNAQEGKLISKMLLEKKLVACTNMFPIESTYWWKGEIQEDMEFVILAKTTDDNFDMVASEIKKNHSYDTPAIYSWLPDKVDKDYDTWVKKEVRGHTK